MHAPHHKSSKFEQIPSLPIMYFNARSLSNKMTLLQNYACEIKPKLIAVTETWAKPEMPDGMYQLHGFNLLRADRHDKRGGGVMIYVDQTISHSQISLCSHPELEFVCCKLQLSNNELIGILCIYRPPNITDTGDLNLINIVDNFMKLKFTYNVILGDFNMPSVDWKTLNGPIKFMPFVRCCSEHFLRQHVNESTRPNSNSILDLIFSTIGTNIGEVAVEECFGSSDHSIINFRLKLPSSYKTFDSHYVKRNYYKADWMLMSDLLSQTDWDSVFNDQNIDNVWKKFKKSLTDAVTSSIPYRKRKPWRLKANPKIRTALRHVRRCYSVYRSQKTNDSLLKFVQAKTYLQEHITKQITYFEKYIVKTLQENPRRYWSYINSKL